MTQKRNDGGPAFPGAVDTAAPPDRSLRDWFAGQALISMGAWSPMMRGGPHGDRAFDLDSEIARRERARWAYAQADAMIAERDK